MTFSPIFPTIEHEDAAKVIKAYFSNIPSVDTVLVVNSCARGHAVQESDLDFAILVKPGVTSDEIQNIESAWQVYSENQPGILKYKQLNPYALLHLDLINGEYHPASLEKGGGPDYFEIEIGNQVCYSASLGQAGAYFKELQHKWMPYYDIDLQSRRLAMTKSSCEYDLNHIPFYIKRGLHFQAFDRLYVAFQKFLQAVFIARRVYPIAYNKWIKLQVETLLNMPELYSMLPSIISVSNIESNEINDKASRLKILLASHT
jgi:predicted nucleotidyltransferase